VFLVEREVGAVLRGAGEEGSVFSWLREGCVCVFGDVGVSVSFEVGVYVGYGFPKGLGTTPSPTQRGDFNAPITGTTTIWEDNHSPITYSHNALVSEKTKHIGMKWHFLRDHVEHGKVMLRCLPTDQMAADMFTKPLARPALTRHRSAILGDAEPMQRFTTYIF
jgi:hypothetical protein